MKLSRLLKTTHVIGIERVVTQNQYKWKQSCHSTSTTKLAFKISPNRPYFCQPFPDTPIKFYVIYTKFLSIAIGCHRKLTWKKPISSSFLPHLPVVECYIQDIKDSFTCLGIFFYWWTILLFEFCYWYFLGFLKSKFSFY